MDPNFVGQLNSTVILFHNHILYVRTKHRALDLFFVREQVLNKSLKVLRIPSQDQCADLLTKQVSTIRFLLERQAQGA